MTMALFFEIVLVSVLVIGLLYFVFDIKDITTKIAAIIHYVVIWVVTGFFIGIGVHLTNLAFGW